MGAALSALSGAAGVGHAWLAELPPEKAHLADVVGVVLYQEGDEAQLRRISQGEAVHVGAAEFFGRSGRHDVAEVAAHGAPPLPLLRQGGPFDHVLDAARLGEIARQRVGERMTQPVGQEVARVGQMRRQERKGVDAALETAECLLIRESVETVEQQVGIQLENRVQRRDL
jgi:hypothetical protein